MASRSARRAREDSADHQSADNARGVLLMSDPTTASPNESAPSAPVRDATPVGGSGTAGLAQFISFAIGVEQYGVDIMAVREIKGWSQITALPRQPDYVRGVLNLRGVMVPIIDLRCRFGQGMTEATPLHIVIVVQIGSAHVGLLADRVLDIVPIDASRVQPVPRVEAGSRVDFLTGLVTIESGMIALIDLSHLLSVAIGEGAEIANPVQKIAA
jgi:purine-binding chemotaxis protein CheW